MRNYQQNVTDKRAH